MTEFTYEYVDQALGLIESQDHGKVAAMEAFLQTHARQLQSPLTRDIASRLWTYCVGSLPDAMAERLLDTMGLDHTADTWIHLVRRHEVVSLDPQVYHLAHEQYSWQTIGQHLRTRRPQVWSEVARTCAGVTVANAMLHMPMNLAVVEEALAACPDGEVVYNRHFVLPNHKIGRPDIPPAAPSWGVLWVNCALDAMGSLDNLETVLDRIVGAGHDLDFTEKGKCGALEWLLKLCEVVPTPKIILLPGGMRSPTPRHHLVWMLLELGCRYEHLEGQVSPAGWDMIQSSPWVRRERLSGQARPKTTRLREESSAGVRRL